VDLDVGYCLPTIKKIRGGAKDGDEASELVDGHTEGTSDLITVRRGIFPDCNRDCKHNRMIMLTQTIKRRTKMVPPFYI